MSNGANHGNAAGNLANAGAQADGQGQGGANAPCKKPPAQPEVKIDAPKTVLVTAAHHGDAPPRICIALRIVDASGSPTSFDGKATLDTNANARVEIYADESGGQPLVLPFDYTGAELFKSRKVYLQATRPSAAALDVEVELKLAQTGVIPVGASSSKDQLTCLEVKLDICKARDLAAPAADPVPLTQNDKIATGRFIHLQDKKPIPVGKNDPALVPADRLRQERAMIVVRAATPADWQGKLVLFCCGKDGKGSSSAIRVFKDEVAAKSQTALASKYEIDHSAGFVEEKLWAEGAKVSGQLLDTGLALGVKDCVTRDGKRWVGDRVAITVIRAELACLRSRTKVPSGDVLPRAMKHDDKFKLGRFVHKQYAEHHGRGGVFVKQVKPAAFAEKLRLTAWDRTANSASTGHIELFDTEVPAAGQAALANPYEEVVGSKGKAFWVQGKATSGALRDMEVRLGIPEHINSCDSALFTVVEFTDLVAEIEPTQPQTARAVNTPVDLHRYKIATGAGADKDYDEDFAVNEPLVLVEGSLPRSKPVRLSVKVAPANVPVLWSVQRNTKGATGDHAKIAKLSQNREKGPSLQKSPGGELEHRMSLDACGSFHVRPFVDCNASKKFEHDDKSGNRIDREPFILMNLVLVRVQMQRDESRARPANASATATGANVDVSTGGFANGAGAGVHCKAKVKVVGGGPDGKVGLDYLFGGWVNNEQSHPGSPAVPQSEDAVATYRDGGPPVVDHVRYSFWTLPPNGGFTAYGPPPPALPASTGGPTLDCTNYGNEGTGGNHCVGTEGAVGPPLPIVKAAAADGLGEDWTIEMWDSPGDSSPVVHPRFAAASLREYRFNLNFRVDLCFWTSQSKAPGPTAGEQPACRLYGSVATHHWTIRFASKYNAVAGTLKKTTVNLKIKKDKDKKKRVIPVEGSGLEVRGPCTLDMLAVNEST